MYMRVDHSVLFPSNMFKITWFYIFALSLSINSTFILFKQIAQAEEVQEHLPRKKTKQTGVRSEVGELKDIDGCGCELSLSLSLPMNIQPSLQGSNVSSESGISEAISSTSSPKLSSFSSYEEPCVNLDLSIALCGA